MCSYGNRVYLQFWSRLSPTWVLYLDSSHLKRLILPQYMVDNKRDLRIHLAGLQKVMLLSGGFRGISPVLIPLNLHACSSETEPFLYTMLTLTWVELGKCIWRRVIPAWVLQTSTLGTTYWMFRRVEAYHTNVTELVVHIKPGDPPNHLLGYVQTTCKFSKLELWIWWGFYVK